MSTNISSISLDNTDSVSFAHISDLHLTPPPIPYSNFLFNKRLLSFILWKIKRSYQHLPEINQLLVSHIEKFNDICSVLITGDITNFGTSEEYKKSVKWLKSLPFNAVIIPGNHDIMCPIKPQDSLNYWTEWSGESYPFVRYYKHVAIIGLNSAFPTPPFKAYGYLSNQQLNRLENILKELREKNYCRVIMIHHPPKMELLKKEKSLLNTKEFSDILNKYGAELVLHGHSHNATITTVENTNIPLIGIGAASMSSSLLHKKASWNHLKFTSQKLERSIELTRYSFEGNIIEERHWERSIR